MKVIQAVHSDDFKSYGTQRIRENFLLDDLKAIDQANFVYTQYDRMIVGLITPESKEVALETYPILRADYFLERREMGIINVGQTGKITADGVTYTLNHMDCLYLGKGTKDVSFLAGAASYYILSAPAHAVHPNAMVQHDQAFSAELGSLKTSNARKISRYIHKDGIQSCQLVMGLTQLQEGSVWNTIPPHTHERRMEAYFYFDLDADQRVFHYMGEPQETRHILVANKEAVLSPPWSIHAGSGTQHYKFIWGMAGENLDYTDMDSFGVDELR
ncbi:MAG: 5-dehydro-4-deoxy-D-glucuronate isomerase [Pedobacter sp.]|nr:MAG: 5-dehydro-4-deoxy-D-glucuronate isomerase [Pedobacter sp.]